MRTYAIVTGAIFGIIVLLHLWRMTVETHLASDPAYLALTLLAAALALWAARIVWRSRNA